MVRHSEEDTVPETEGAAASDSSTSAILFDSLSLQVTSQKLTQHLRGAGLSSLHSVLEQLGILTFHCALAQRRRQSLLASKAGSILPREPRDEATEPSAFEISMCPGVLAYQRPVISGQNSPQYKYQVGKRYRRVNIK